MSGCVTRVTDSEGNIHTVGLFWQTTVPVKKVVEGGDSSEVRFTAGRIRDSDARLVRLRTVGALFSWTDVERGLSLGWSDSLVVYPDPDGLTFANFDSNEPLNAGLAAARTETQPNPESIYMGSATK